MKRIAFFIGIVTGLIASCSVQEEEFEVPSHDEVMFYASFEQPVEGTRVYANEDLHLRWTADDRVSIFNNNTYNQQYRFLGETGDNSGGFAKVDGAEFVTGNPISHVVSVYPFLESTVISEDEVLSIMLPFAPNYSENTFGLGDNTMVAISSDNVLMYKNVGGYLMLRLYGEGVKVSSVIIKGNNGEKIAGKALVRTTLDGSPSVEMTDEAREEINMQCHNRLPLGRTVEESTAFWFVLPPMTFQKGFTVIVSGDHKRYEISTDKPVTIERNRVSKMSPKEINQSQLLNVVYYTSSDGQVVKPYVPANSSIAFGTPMNSNQYSEGIGIMSFSNIVTTIGEMAFYDCTTLTSITIPIGVESIGNSAFYNCTCLSDVNIPNKVSSIGPRAFSECTSLTNITIPRSVERIGYGAFYGCSNLSSVTVLSEVPPVGQDDMFTDTNNCPIYVPAESVDSYKSAQYWNQYVDRIFPIGTPQAIDLGLPSGLKWASWNLGATAPEEYGDYYAWGEREPYYEPGYAQSDNPVWRAGKENGYDWLTYRWCRGSSDTMTKYCSDSSFGHNGFIDDKTVLDLEDDVAYVNLGGLWRMPTRTDVLELLRNCSARWTSMNGIPGCHFIGPNGNSIFLPYAGYRDGLSQVSVGEEGYFWSSWGANKSGSYMHVGPGSIGVGPFSRCFGLPVRPVYGDGDYVHVESVSLYKESLEVGVGKQRTLVAIVLPENAPYKSVSWSSSNESVATVSARGVVTGIAIGSAVITVTSIDGGKTASCYVIVSEFSTPAEAIDLGLPSGLKWASFNLGASDPEENGDYYAWGEIEPYYSSIDPQKWKKGKEDGYTWSSYRWCMGSMITLTKYCDEPYSGYNGFTDSKTILDSEDDAAYVNWGGSWRMPTDAEFMELRMNCSWEWTSMNGIPGCRVTGPNGNSLFLPAVGYRDGGSVVNEGHYGYFWSSSLNTDFSVEALGMHFDMNSLYSLGSNRYQGRSVRPVCE